MYLGLSFWQLANSIMHGIYITVFGKISADQTTIVFDKSQNMGYKSLTAECCVAILSTTFSKEKRLVLNSFVL